MPEKRTSTEQQMRLKQITQRCETNAAKVAIKQRKQKRIVARVHTLMKKCVFWLSKT